MKLGEKKTPLELGELISLEDLFYTRGGDRELRAV